MPRAEGKRTVFVHLGLSRAASTFLQRQVFPKFRGIVSFPKQDYRNRMELLAQTPGQRFLFSHEGISRRRERLQTLQRDLPSCRPILVLRRQDQWLASRYKYQLHKRGYCPFEVFLERFERDAEHGECEPAQFAPYLEQLEKSFGNRPLVLLHEELLAEPVAAIQLLADGVGAKVNMADLQLKQLNASLSDRRLQALRSFDTRFSYRRRRSGSVLAQRIDKGFRDIRVGVADLLARARPSRAAQHSSLVPPDQLEALRERYASDWEACLEYLQRDRELLIGPSHR